MVAQIRRLPIPQKGHHLLEQQSKFAEFLDVLRSPKTAANYSDSILCLVCAAAS
jgi:hypothetical protein